MEPVFESNEVLRKQKMAYGENARKIRWALGILLFAAVVLNMLPMGLRAVSVYAAEEGVILCGQHKAHTKKCGYAQTTECTYGHINECNRTATEYVHINAQGYLLESVSGNETAAFTMSSAPLSVPGDLDLSGNTGDEGDLETDGYHWSAASRILQLKNIYISGAVILPDDTVTIETSGNCTIAEIIGNRDMYGNPNPQKTQLTFSGDGQLTVEQRINLSGGDNNTLTVAAGAQVVARGGISMGASGNVNSIVTVNGIMTTETDAISAGKLVVGGGGELNVLGGQGVTLNGMTRDDGSYDYAGVFTIERGGCFNAKCDEFGVRVYCPTGSNLDQAISLPDPEAYLPKDCMVGQAKDGMIRLERRSTGQEYPGCLTIHENHEWPDDYRRDGTKHWKECTYEGCDQTTDEHVHNFGDGSGDGKCVCGSRVVVTLSDAEGLIYDGGEKKPGVTVKVDLETGDGADYRELDLSNYTTYYVDNINAGRASVAVKGKDVSDAPVFEQTVQFEIGKAVPTIVWSSTEQELTYTGSAAVIAPPTVTLVGGETYAGAIQYFYAAEDSESYLPGLPQDIGTYIIRASIAEQGNYMAAESTAPLTLIISKAGQETDSSEKPDETVAADNTSVESTENELLSAPKDEHYIISPQTGETYERMVWVIILLSAATLAWRLCKRMKAIGSDMKTS